MGPPLVAVGRGPWLEVEPGRESVLKVEDWAEIRRLAMSEGLSIKEITRRLDVIAWRNRNAHDRALTELVRRANVA